MDNIRISKSITLPKEAVKRVQGPFEHNGLLLIPCYDDFGGVKSYTGNLKNLRITLSLYDDKLSVTNSLHKYYKGYNNSDFSLSELKHSIDCLCDELHFDLLDAEIKKVEYGCNLSVNSSGALINCLSSYKGKGFGEMSYKGKAYGAKCEMAQYAIKGYDKSLETLLHTKQRIDEKLFRWEVAINKMQCLHSKKPQIPIFRLKDLSEVDKLQFLAFDMCQRFNDVLWKPALDLAGLRVEEKRVYACWQSKEVWEDLKINHKETYKKYNRTVKVLFEKSGGSYKEVGRKLQEKCTELLNN